MLLDSLAPGAYTFTVSGYINGHLVAETDNDITISGSETSVTLSLKDIASGNAGDLTLIVYLPYDCSGYDATSSITVTFTDGAVYKTTFGELSGHITEGSDEDGDYIEVVIPSGEALWTTGGVASALPAGVGEMVLSLSYDGETSESRAYCTLWSGVGLTGRVDMRSGEDALISFILTAELISSSSMSSDYGLVIENLEEFNGAEIKLIGYKVNKSGEIVDQAERDVSAGELFNQSFIKRNGSGSAGGSESFGFEVYILTSDKAIPLYLYSDTEYENQCLIADGTIDMQLPNILSNNNYSGIANVQEWNTTMNQLPKVCLRTETTETGGTAYYVDNLELFPPETIFKVERYDSDGSFIDRLSGTYTKDEIINQSISAINPSGSPAQQKTIITAECMSSYLEYISSEAIFEYTGGIG